MKSENLEPIPQNSNPFHHDAYHMGTRVASNVTIMHATHPSEKAAYVIVVNNVTGKRIKVTV